jgi:hypothetical protein
MMLTKAVVSLLNIARKVPCEQMCMTKRKITVSDESGWKKVDKTANYIHPLFSP